MQGLEGVYKVAWGFTIEGYSIYGYIGSYEFISYYMRLYIRSSEAWGCVGVYRPIIHWGVGRGDLNDFQSRVFLNGDIWGGGHKLI